MQQNIQPLFPKLMSALLAGCCLSTSVAFPVFSEVPALSQPDISAIIPISTDASERELETLMDPRLTSPQVKGEVSVNDMRQIMLNPQRVVEFVTTDNLDLALANAQIDQAKWEYYGSFSRLLPSINGQISLDKFTGSDVIIGATPFNINRVTQRQRLAINYDIHTGFKPLWQASAMKQQLNRTKNIHDRTLQKSLLDALSQYYTWLRESSQVRFAQQTYHESVAQREQDEARYETGFGTRLEIEQSSVLEAERKSDLLSARAGELWSGHQMASMLNIPMNYSLVPESRTLEPVLYWSSSAMLPELFELAVENRPDVKALTNSIQEAKATMWGTLSDVMPTIRLSSYIGNVGPPDTALGRQFDRSVQLNFDTLNYMGLATFSNYKAEQAKVKQAILQKEKQLNAIRDDLAKAYYDWVLSEKQMGVSRQKFDSAKEALRIAQARKQTGVGTQLELFQTETKVWEAYQENLDAVMSFNNAQLKLLYETGQLTPDEVLAAVQSEKENGQQVASKTIGIDAETQTTEKQNAEEVLAKIEDPELREAYLLYLEESQTGLQNTPEPTGQ